MKKQRTSQKGITLISLVVTIIVLLILAGVSIQLIVGGNGILTRASGALDANDKATATEKMELKITHLNMVSYGENMRKATLQELADGLFVDKEVEYVKLKNQEVATLQPIDVTGASSFFVKLKEYSYEFEIDENLQLASVDGVEIAKPETIPDGYIKPSGTISVTENGEYDVKTYEKAEVNVPTYEKDSVLAITEKSDKIDVSQYQYVDTSGLYTEEDLIGTGGKVASGKLQTSRWW